MQNNKKEGKIKMSIPVCVTWPITLERYRQVLAKMHRQWQDIQNLELEVDRLKEELERAQK